MAILHYENLQITLLNKNVGEATDLVANFVERHDAETHEKFSNLFL